MSEPGLTAYKMAFELCPIILTGGLAGFIPGGMLPIISITEGLNFTAGLLSGSDVTNLDNFFAHFKPVGAVLIAQKIGKYPFANQAVAANAVIADAKTVSMMMTAPARGDGAYAIKLATMMALQAALNQHNISGGTYTIATPSYFYTNCVMLGMRDVTPEASKQPQIVWQIDFEQPLLTMADAFQAQNSLMAKITDGSQINGQPAWSGAGPTVGIPPSLAGPSIIPAASNLPGAIAAAPTVATTGSP